MDINKREPIVGLIQGYVTGFTGDSVVDAEVGVIPHVDGQGGSGRVPLLGEIFFGHLLPTDVVNDVLTMSEEEGSHVEVEVEVDVGMCGEEGVCSTAVFTRD